MMDKCKAKNIREKIWVIPALMAHLEDELCFQTNQSLLPLQNVS